MRKFSLSFRAALLILVVIGEALLYVPQPAFAQTQVKPPAVKPIEKKDSTTATQTNTPVVGAKAGAPSVVYQGVEGSIQRLLCAPGMSTNFAEDKESATAGPNTFGPSNVTNVNAKDLSVCINRLYRFGVVLGSIAGVFFVALAGYIYIMGGEHSKEKAKHIIFSVIAGLVIILTAYILIKQINPEALKFKTIQPPQLSNVPELKSCGDIGLAEDCALDGDGESDDTSGNNNVGTGGPGTAGTYTDAQAKALLKSAGIVLQGSAVMFNNVQKRVVEEVIAVKNASKAAMSIGAGTNGTHASGQCSHANGYKVDLNYSSSQDLNDYVHSKFTNIGKRTNDGAVKYLNKASGAVWAQEFRGGKYHWDVVVKCP